MLSGKDKAPTYIIFTHRWMNKWNIKIKPWNTIFNAIAMKSKAIESSFLLQKFVYINTKQSTLKCSLFYMMTEYNAFIMTLRTTSEKKRCLQLRTESSNYTKLMKAIKAMKSTVSQVKAYNQRHKPKTYNKNNLVLLSMKNLSQKRLNKKLSHKFAESFHIQDIVEKQAYCLYLSTTEFIMFSCLIPWTLQSMSK
jgi:hypothetical protein